MGTAMASALGRILRLGVGYGMMSIRLQFLAVAAVGRATGRTTVLTWLFVRPEARQYLP